MRCRLQARHPDRLPFTDMYGSCQVDKIVGRALKSLGTNGVVIHRDAFLKARQLTRVRSLGTKHMQGICSWCPAGLCSSV